MIFYQILDFCTVVNAFGQKFIYFLFSVEHQNVLKEYVSIKGELSALRQTYNNKADEWIKEKLDLQYRMKDLQDSLISSAGRVRKNIPKSKTQPCLLEGCGF